MKASGAILLQIILLELILGGGGRFTVFGPVSLRMVLFGVAILYTIYRVWRGDRIGIQYSGLILLFVVITVFSMLLGLSGEAANTLVFEDVKPLSFFLILPFFVLTINDPDTLVKISKLIIYGALTLSITYLITLVLVNTGIIPFKAFYTLTAPTEELFYRGELAFFYKGFIFLCIGLIFIYFRKPKHWAVLACIIVLAIILTFTRGFILALLLTALVYLMLEHTSLRLRLLVLPLLLVSAAIIGFKGNDIYAGISRTIYESELKPGFTRDFKPENLLGNRDFSNSERKKQLDQVLERTTLSSSLIGHGFGLGVPVRPVHMEISYLEIFHKQGILGLLFWGLIFFMLTKRYFSASRKYAALSSAFYFGALFIFFQSMTNQYFNNPIGMSFILVALVSLDVTSSAHD